jgi:5,10-methylenetetrahydromethanopterin reductase
LAERLGLDEFWIGDEGSARDPFGLLAAAAVLTERIRLGVAVTNPYLRHPLTIAAEAMTVHELSGGRMTLGLGPGGRIALDPAGVVRARPLAAVREALRIIRAVCDGRAVDGYHPPAAPFVRPDLPVFIGSRSRAFQRLASAEADGVFLGGLPAAVIGQTAAWARSLRAIPVALYSTVAFTRADADRVRAGLISVLADSPDHVLRTLALDRAVVTAAALRQADGDPSLAESTVTDALVDDLVLLGDPRQVGRELAARVRQHRPESIGVTVTSDDPEAAVVAAAAAFEELDRELA